LPPPPYPHQLMLKFMLRRGKWTENASVYYPGRTGAFHHQLSSRPGFGAAVAHIASCTHTIRKHVLFYVFS